MPTDAATAIAYTGAFAGLVGLVCTGTRNPTISLGYFRLICHRDPQGENHLKLRRKGGLRKFDELSISATAWTFWSPSSARDPDLIGEGGSVASDDSLSSKWRLRFSAAPEN